MDNFKRLYIVTGKGGVGKTTIALALTKYLQQNKQNAEYCYFEDSNSDEFEKSIKELSISSRKLQLYKEVEDYVGKKVGSKTIANWIVKTPFFKAMFNMIPGFSYLIYLGSILQELNDDPTKIIILDSPASGHALTMLEATGNFREIFQKGVIFDDTTKMLNFLYAPDTSKIIVVSIPTEMALNEGKELFHQINEIPVSEKEIILNNSISALNLSEQDCPDFIQKKIEIEKELLCNSEIKFKNIFPYISQTNAKEITNKLTPLIGSLL